ncbi:hypothetical protein LIER_27404 [Lithospermum erythrorhizon]|uniref:Reverse transcriptase/retrotransposon-derived protein RNase H-like domain-containing protein n=1 Tax=Lithospermum erythrorhizon TaxID=34254 RepID=A0AAV3RFV3_LITER
MSPPVLASPIQGKPLILYITTQEQSVGALLAQENGEGNENSLYYLSQRMTPNELKYLPIEKLCLALIFSIQKLKHYFQAHMKVVKGQVLADFLADHPLPTKWKLCDELQDEDLMNIGIMPLWQMYFDGAAHQEGPGTGVVFITPQQDLLPYSFSLSHQCSNNVAEYQTLILGLEVTADLIIP